MNRACQFSGDVRDINFIMQISISQISLWKFIVAIFVNVLSIMFLVWISHYIFYYFFKKIKQKIILSVLGYSLIFLFLFSDLISLALDKITVKCKSLGDLQNSLTSKKYVSWNKWITVMQSWLRLTSSNYDCTWMHYGPWD